MSPMVRGPESGDRPQMSTPAGDKAFSDLYNLFHPVYERLDPLGAVQENARIQQEAAERLNTVMHTYVDLSFQATHEYGLNDEAADRFVQRELERRGIIEVDDPATAREKFRIIDQGYRLNRDYWNQRLAVDRARKMTFNDPFADVPPRE